MTKEMAGIPFRIKGRLYSGGERTAIHLVQDGQTCTLRLAYEMRGTEEKFLPESMLDDWGHEISGSELYKWVKRNAEHFPRAELFGFDLAGRKQQCFIRDLDLTSRSVAYIFEGPSDAIESGARLHAILVTDNEQAQRQLPEAPANIPFPLREAAVEWWMVKDLPVGPGDHGFPGILNGA